MRPSRRDWKRFQSRCITPVRIGPCTLTGSAAAQGGTPAVAIHDTNAVSFCAFATNLSRSAQLNCPEVGSIFGQASLASYPERQKKRQASYWDLCSAFQNRWREQARYIRLLMPVCLP